MRRSIGLDKPGQLMSSPAPRKPVAISGLRFYIAFKRIKNFASVEFRPTAAGLAEMRNPVLFFLARASFQGGVFLFFGECAYAKPHGVFARTPLIGQLPRNCARRDAPQAPASMVTRVRSRRRLHSTQSNKLGFHSPRSQRRREFNLQHVRTSPGD
jgi:hypothetical protein